MILLKYMIIQLLAYGIDMGIFFFSLYSELLGPVSANIAAKLAAGWFAFFAHRSFTFDVADADRIRQQILRYFAVLVLYIPITSAILVVIIFWISNPVIAKLISDAVCIVISYGLGKYYIFNAANKISHNSLPSVEK